MLHLMWWYAIFSILHFCVLFYLIEVNTAVVLDSIFVSVLNFIDTKKQCRFIHCCELGYGESHVLVTGVFQ